MHENVVSRASVALRGAEASNQSTFWHLCAGQMAVERIKAIGATDENLEALLDRAIALQKELAIVLTALHDGAEAKRLELGWSEPSNESGGPK